MNLLTRRTRSDNDHGHDYGPGHVDELDQADRGEPEAANRRHTLAWARLWRPAEADQGVPQWTGPSAAATKGLGFLLWALLAAGPIALVLVLLGGAGTTAPAPLPTRSENAGERAAVTAFGEEFVATWLRARRGDGAALEPFILDASSATLPEQPWTVSDVATAAVEQVQGHLWSTTVAVTVTAPQVDTQVDRSSRTAEQDADQAAATDTDQPTPERRYFQVAVRYDEGALRAQTLPAPVAAPGVAEPAPLDYRHRVPTSDPVATAAGEFLAALLTGTSDVSRYVSPGAEIAAVTPPPYTAVALDDVALDIELPTGEPADGEQRRLLVTATTTTPQEQLLSVQYALTTTARDGRWEISSIDPTPSVQAPEPAPTGSGPTDSGPTDSGPTGSDPTADSAN